MFSPMVFSTALCEVLAFTLSSRVHPRKKTNGGTWETKTAREILVDVFFIVGLSGPVILVGPLHPATV